MLRRLGSHAVDVLPIVNTASRCLAVVYSRATVQTPRAVSGLVIARVASPAMVRRLAIKRATIRIERLLQAVDRRGFTVRPHHFKVSIYGRGRQDPIRLLQAPSP